MHTNRTTRIIWLALALLLLAGTQRGLLAQENDHGFVIGATLVSQQSYWGDSGFRNASNVSHSGHMDYRHVLLEIYPMDRLGIGARWVKVTAKRDEGSEFAPIAILKTTLTTLNYMFYISNDRELRWGVTAGSGSARYTAEDDLGTQYSARGGVTNGELWLDWGGEGLGARFGYGALLTALRKPMVNGAPAGGAFGTRREGSGNYGYAGIRLAF